MNQSQNLYQSGALALINRMVDQRQFPTAVDVFAVANHLAKLMEIQDERVRTGRRKLREPLLWLALAQAAGLEVNERGFISNGPQLPGVQP